MIHSRQKTQQNSFVFIWWIHMREMLGLLSDLSIFHCTQSKPKLTRTARFFSEICAKTEIRRPISVLSTVYPALAFGFNVKGVWKKRITCQNNDKIEIEPNRQTATSECIYFIALHVIFAMDQQLSSCLFQPLGIHSNITYERTWNLLVWKGISQETFECVCL